MILSTPSRLKVCLLGMLLLAGGCAKQIIPVNYPPQSPPSPEPQPAVADTPQPRAPAARVPDAPQATAAPGPRQAAARNLTREGAGLLGQGAVAAAIDTLEQSLTLDARNGETYYYLAEAWHRRGNRSRAVQFHRLARTYLSGRAGWQAKLDRQAGGLGL